MKSKLQIIPLGGVGEVGRNLTVYGYDDQYLIVDTGLMFPEHNMLGVDYIIPDLTFLKDKRHKISGIVITHGHEDHIGAIHHVVEELHAPIYATPLTRGLLEVKLARHNLIQKTEIFTVQAGETVHIGPFQVEFFHVCHSIPDSVGLGIQTPVGLVVHTGDYKFDHTPVDNWPTDFAKLAEFSRRGVLALLADSTNSVRPGWTPSERVVDAALEQVFLKAKGRIIIASFASLISRMQQVVNAAARHNKKLAFVGTSMVDNARMARKLGYLDVPEDILITIDQARNIPDDEVVLMCTGSQGEPTSILGRLSVGSHRQLEIKPGDTVVLSSHPIPGNEEDVYRTINRLFERGAEVIYEEIAPVHVSGHASQEEIKLLLNLVRPKYLIPIHGELRHLKQHTVLAEQVGIPAENIFIITNGQTLEVDASGVQLGERVPAELVFVDGSGVGDIGPAVMRERETLSQDGIVMVNITMAKDSDTLYAEPQIVTRGFILNSEAEAVINQAQKKVLDTIGRANGNLAKDVEQSLRTFLYNETHRSPMVLVAVNRI